MGSSFRLQMEITYEDGSKEMIVSDESWLWTSGPVLKGIYMLVRCMMLQRKLKVGQKLELN